MMVQWLDFANENDGCGGEMRRQLQQGMLNATAESESNGRHRHQHY
jgi:hypothetical protein